MATSHQCASDVINVSVSSDTESPVKLISSLVDLSRVTKLWLGLCFRTDLDAIRFDYLIDLLQQTPNLLSLTFEWRAQFEEDRFFAQEICSVIIRRFNRSTLRHLNISIFNLDQLKMLLDRMTNLLSLKVCLSMKSPTSAEIIDFVNKLLMNECSILEDSDSVSIWMDARVKKNSGCKRIKLSH